MPSKNMKKNLSNLSSRNQLQKSTQDYIIESKKNDKLKKDSNESFNFDFKFIKNFNFPKSNPYNYKPIFSQRNDTLFDNTLPNETQTLNSHTNNTHHNYTQHSDSRVAENKGKITFSL